MSRHTLKFSLNGSVLMLAGIGSPILWACLHYILFGDPAASGWGQIFNSLWGTPANLALSIFLAASCSIGLLFTAVHSDLWETRARQRQQAVEELEAQLDLRSSELNQLEHNLDRKLKRFHETNAHLQQSLDRREIMRLAADSLKEILEYDRVNVLLCTDSGEELEFIASRGTGDDDVAGTTLPLDERAGVIYLALRHRHEPLLIDDMRNMPVDYHLRAPWDTIPQLRSRSFILCPIVVNGKAVGVFGVDNKEKRTTLGDNDLDTVRIFSEQVAAALSKIDLLRAVELLTGEIQRTFSQSLQHEDHFGKLVQEVKQDTTDTSVSIEQLRLTTDTLYQAIDDTNSAASEISATVQQVSGNLQRLDELLSQAIAATDEISAASREIAEHADQSHNMAIKVQQDAKEGTEKVDRVHRWLQDISSSIDETALAFTALAEKTVNIDHFLALITEINQKTKLLSLNASIIAAQAGEHGRPFAVVADQIHLLHGETSESVQAIETLVKQVRQLADTATDKVYQTRSIAHEGVSFSQTTGQTLRQIATSASQALVLAGNINHASREQSVNANHSAASIREMGEIAGMVTAASREQATAIGRIARQVNDIETLGGTTNKATGQQQEGINHIDAMMDQVQVMAQQIFTEISHRQSESEAVIARLAGFKQSATQDSRNKITSA